MSELETIRAWKDEDYFSSLSEAERASIPENPAGVVELSLNQLRESEVFFPLTIVTIALCEPLPSNVTVCPIYY